MNSPTTFDSQYGIDIITKVHISTNASQIIITGIPKSFNEEPLIIAEKVLETIGIENPKLGITTSRKVVKKHNTSNSASDSMPKSQTSPPMFDFNVSNIPIYTIYTKK